MLTRVCILLIAATIVAQPLLSAVLGGCDCCKSVPASVLGVMGCCGDAQAEVDEQMMACCCLGSCDVGAPASSDDEQSDDEDRPDGCDCPKTRCSGTVKVQLACSELRAPPAVGEDPRNWSGICEDADPYPSRSLAGLLKPPRTRAA